MKFSYITQMGGFSNKTDVEIVFSEIFSAITSSAINENKIRVSSKYTYELL